MSINYAPMRALMLKWAITRRRSAMAVGGLPRSPEGRFEDRDPARARPEGGFGSLRLLEVARASGQVCIEIREPEVIDVELSRRVHIRFSLAHAIDRREGRGAR